MIDPDGGVYTFAEYEKLCDELGYLPAYPQDWQIRYCTEDEIHNHQMNVHRDFIEATSKIWDFLE